jgi:hypothetical protein
VPNGAEEDPPGTLRPAAVDDGATTIGGAAPGRPGTRPPASRVFVVVISNSIADGGDGEDGDRATRRERAFLRPRACGSPGARIRTDGIIICE